MSTAISLKGETGIAIFDNEQHAPLQQSMGSTPYIVFANPKQDKWSDVIMKLRHAPAEGTPLLFIPGDSEDAAEIVALPGMRFFLSPGYVQHYSTTTEKNEVLHTVFPPAKQPDYDHKEHVEAIVFAITPNGVVPARLTFRTTKCKAAHSMVSEIAAAQREAWAGSSNDHATAFKAIGKAWQRVTGTITLTQETSKARPATATKAAQPARPYVVADATTQPTSAGDYTALAKCFTEQRELIGKVVEEFNRRLGDIKSKA